MLFKFFAYVSFVALAICTRGSGLLVGQSVGAETLPGFLEEAVAGNTVFAEGVTGFHLYDLDERREVYGYNEERRFVPASNVKLLTFFLAHRVLGHRSPAVYYQEFYNRIEVWGAGYPLLLHPAFAGYDELTPWLVSRTVPVIVNAPEADEPARYGTGWSWDDYDYGYVYERSGLPVYGNRLHLEPGPPDAYGREQLYGVPPEVTRSLIQDERQRRLVHREEADNLFTLRGDFTATARFPVERALITDPDFTVRQLREAFGENRIRGGKLPRPDPAKLQRLDVSVPDTVYRKLLRDSDNYLAEQLVLQCAARRYGRFDESALFDYATDTLFTELDLGELRYADGSGLSRYNLVKPRQLTRIVAALYEEIGTDRLVDLLPAGGYSGTLKTRFDDRPETYVWAKTGSLSGVMCISGLLRAKSGKWLAFSFLHNNVLGGTRQYYAEMERVLGTVYDVL